MRRPSLHLASLAAVTLTAGCGGREGAPAVAELPTWTAREELRVGSVDDPELAFTRVQALAVGEDGSLYSLHPQEAVVRRWTAEGRPAGTVGREGEGPGEFDSPSDLGWTGDTLWVFDRRRYQVSHFAPDGSFLYVVTPEVRLGTREQWESGVFPARPASRLEGGSLYARTPGWSREIVAGDLTALAHLRMSPDGAEGDTLAVTPTGPWDVMGVLRDGGGSFSNQPFGDGVLTAVTDGGGGLLVLDRRVPAQPAPGGPVWRLSRIALSGDTVFSRAYPYEPVVLTAASADSAVAADAGRWHGWVGERDGTTLAQWTSWVGEALYRPRHHPPVKEMVPGRDGTVWVAENPPVEEGRPWLVLDGGGEPLARVVLPGGLRVLEAERGAVWGVETDQLDVEYLVRYAVVVP